jgi:GNAT superfamily N-acetyltransferase
MRRSTLLAAMRSSKASRTYSAIPAAAPSAQPPSAASAVSLRSTVTAWVLGFLTIKQHFNESGEITRMAVQASHRRHGIGRALINAIGADLSKAGLAELFVLTLGPSVAEPDSEDNYEGTRRFYQSAGFVPLRELSLRTWSDDYALILARHLRSD